MRRIIGALGEQRDRLGLDARTSNAISYPDEPGLRKPDSLHFFRIVKEQPKQTHRESPRRALRAELVEKLVEPTGIEPVTSCLQSRRSPS